MHNPGRSTLHLSTEIIQNNSIIYDRSELTQTAREIQALLTLISQKYLNTTVGQIQVVAKAIEIIKNNSDLKNRVVSALKKAGNTVLEKAIEHPAAKIFIAGAKAWFSTAK